MEAKTITPTTYHDLLKSRKTTSQDEIPFEYTPLPTNTHTRLITLLPGDETSPIKCLLSISDLSKNPSYESLSYVWGSTESEYGIEINGRPFPVGKLLCLALYHLRHTTESQTLWIDAISINQKDEAEKQIQILQMGNIYSQASQVLVWLGAYTNKYIEEAIDIMRMLHANIPDEVKRDWSIMSPKIEVAADHMAEICDEFRQLAIELLRKHPHSTQCMKLIFSDCPVLESIMDHSRSPFGKEDKALLRNTTIFLGNIQRINLGAGIDWDDVQRAFNMATASKLARQRKEHDDDLGTLRHYNLRGLLNSSLSAQCKILQDKIYGLLGLIDVPNMLVNYQKPMFEVFTDTLQHFEDPSIRGKGDQFDFHTVFFAQIMQNLLKGPFMNSHPNIPCFRISGFASGKIMQIGTTCTLDDSFKEVKAKLEDLFKSHPSATLDIPFEKNATTPEQKFAQIQAQEHARAYGLPNTDRISLIVSKSASIYESKCMNTIQPWNANYFRARIQTYDRDSSMQESVKLNIQEESTRTDGTESSSTQPPNLFLTSTLEFGLCPASALPGDILVQFLNTDTAAIIREVVDMAQQTQYCLIGRAFVGRNGGVDANMKMLNSTDVINVKQHGAIIRMEEVEEGGLTSRVDMVIDGETLQYLTCPLNTS